MTDEELVTLSENRDLYDAWRGEVITLTEAAYICRRTAFYAWMRGRGVKDGLASFVLRIYDVLFEQQAIR